MFDSLLPLQVVKLHGPLGSMWTGSWKTGWLKSITVS